MNILFSLMLVLLVRQDSVVKRLQLGSTIEEHSSGSLITKISGNYNIVGNNINFGFPIW